MKKHTFESLHPGRTELIAAYRDKNNPTITDKFNLSPGRLYLHKNSYWDNSKKIYGGEPDTFKESDDQRHINMEGKNLVNNSVSNRLDSIVSRLNSKVTNFKKGN